MSAFLQERAEGYVAKWIMETPDGLDELDAYWFYSVTGKAIVWAVIKAKKSGVVTLDTIKQACEWNKTRAEPEYFDAVWNQQPISDEAMDYCIQYFKTMGMITNLKESEMDDKIKFTENQSNAVAKIIEHVKANTDTQQMHDVIHKFWCAKLNKQPKLSRKAKLIRLQLKEQEILNKFK
tara:strand:+ start:296 stop:832 length:537 start_codon:yes stop_codon:yes gene_type:complete